jgi:hypothetical protein
VNAVALVPDQHHLWIAVVTLLVAAACLRRIKPEQPIDRVAKFHWRPETTGSRSEQAGRRPGRAVLDNIATVALAVGALIGVLMFFDLLPSI